MFNYMVWTYAGRSKRNVKLETSSKFATNWPVQRALEKGNLCSPELDIYSNLLYMHVAANPVRINI